MNFCMVASTNTGKSRFNAYFGSDDAIINEEKIKEKLE